jgi:predicted CXXCH cytochrome family protein
MRVLPLLCVMAAGLSAQEQDTAALKPSRHPVSLPDRAESEAERRDFAALEKAKDPALQRALTDNFLASYPGSWLLADVYRVGASASLLLNQLRRVLEDGRESLRLLPENPPLLLVLAQIELRMGDTQQAGRDARDAMLWLSMLPPPAGANAAEGDRARQALETSARLIVERAGGRPSTNETTPRYPRDTKEAFAGSPACKECHSTIAGFWQQTGMAKMLRPVSDAKLLADFSQVQEFRGRNEEVALRRGGGDHPWFEFVQPGGPRKRFSVDYAIGSKWQQAYATSLPDGRIFVFPLQYSLLQKKWLNYWLTIDPPDSERARLDRFARLAPATNYQRNCAVCHTSQLRLTQSVDPTMEHAAFREPGINCEMCHGPSARHVERMRSGTKEVSPPNTPPFRFARLDNREATFICGQCHRQSALRNLGTDGEMNYTLEKPWFPRLPGQPYAEFGRRAFYKDGRFRETTFIGESFMRSACFRRGTAQCASCHNPHPPDAADNPTSVKFRADPDRMCLQCHSAIGPKIEAHTHHATGSEGARCVSCHMPRIMNSLLFQARSHQTDDIPRAASTARFGPNESPNACLICHRDRDAVWLAAQLQNWSRRADASASDPNYP